MDKYIQVGAVKYIDGNPYFVFGETDNGRVFKDEDAYNNDWDAPCYVPEAAQKNYRRNDFDCGGSKEECNWFSHNDLLAICNYNHKICDDMFSCLDWSYPSTWLFDARIDYNYAYDFVKVGAKVFWNDPDYDLTSRFETVLQIPKEDIWDEDSIVVLGNGTEVRLCELTEFCPHVKLYGQAVRDLAVVISWAKQAKSLNEFHVNMENIGAECFRCEEETVALNYGVIQCNADVLDEQGNFDVCKFVDIWDEENREWYMESAHIPQEELAMYE